MKTKERNRYLKKRLEPCQPSTSSTIGGRVFPGLPRMGEAEGTLYPGHGSHFRGEHEHDWVSFPYREDPNRPVIPVTFQGRGTPFAAIPVTSPKGVPFSYSRSRVIQYHSKERHWGEPAQLRNELKLYIFNCQGLRCAASQKKLTRKEKKQMIQNGVQPFDQYQLHLKVVGGVCYALVIRSGVNVPYLEERGYHFERREYRFNFRHVPDSMRDQLLKSFPQGGKKGCSFLERGELPQSGGELFLPDHFTNLL